MSILEQLSSRDIKRFWSKVNKGGVCECWEWTGSSNDGYGRLWFGQKAVAAHRISWVVHNGGNLGKLHVLHTCDNRACVNPSHLFLGTNDDNVQDRTLKGRSARHQGRNNGRCKLDESDVREIYRLYNHEDGWSMPKLAKAYGIGVSTVRDILNGKNWSHLNLLGK